MMNDGRLRNKLSNLYHSIRISVLRGFRMATAFMRAEPDFFIIGVQKGGTTSLFHYLSAHPQVASALRKEPFYYLWNFDKGPEWYRSNFPLMSKFEAKNRRAGPQCLVYEASTHYIFYPEAARRIVADCPDANFILVLRDPVERAFSHWRHRMRRKEEARSFEDCIAHELSVSSSEVMAERLHPESLDLEWCESHYLAHGLYLEQIEGWLEVVERKRLLILISEDFFDNPEASMRQTEEFLGIQHSPPIGGFKVHNKGRSGKMNEATRERLGEYYRRSNERLAQFLGRTLPWSS